MHESRYENATQLLGQLLEEERNLRSSTQLLRAELTRLSTEHEQRNQELRKLTRSCLSLASPQVLVPPQAQSTVSKASDTQLRDLVTTLSKNSIPLLPTRRPAPARVTTLAVHSVKIHYVKHLQDGQIERFSTGNVAMCVFRLTRTTTLEDLKEAACRYWEVPSSAEVSLRWNVGTRLGLVDTGPLHRILEEQLIPPELWLLKSNPRCTQLFPGQEDCYTRDSPAPRPKMHLNADQIEKSSRSNLRALAKKFPGLPLHPRPPKAQPKRPLSCTTCSSSLTLLLLTVFLVAVRSDTKDAFMMHRAVTASLDGFDQITSFKDLSVYFSNKLPGAFFPRVTGVSGLPRLKVPMLLGPLRLRIVRSRTTDCPSSLTNDTCYLAYSTSSKETGDLVGGALPWNFYRSEEETHITSTIRGRVSSYDGSGYVMDVHANASVEDFSLMWHTMGTGGWLDPSVRALFCSLVGYEPSADLWWHLDILVEMSISGSIVPAPLTVHTFRPHSSSAVLALEVLRLLCSLHLLYYIATEFAQRVSLTWRFHWNYFWSCTFWLDAVTWALIVSEFGLEVSQRLDPVELLRSVEFRDVRQHAETQAAAKSLNLIVLMFLIIRYSLTFRFQPGFLVAHITMRKSLLALLPYLVLLTPAFVGLTIAAACIWGQYNLAFNSFGSAFVSTILAGLGILPVEKMYMQNPVWTAFFLLGSVLFSSFYLLAAFRGIYIDTRMQVRQEHGYQTWELDKTKVIWWVMGFLPVRMRFVLERWWRDRKMPPLDTEQVMQEKPEDATALD